MENSCQMFHVQQQILDADVFIGGMNLLERIAAAEREAIHFKEVHRSRSSTRGVHDKRVSVDLLTSLANNFKIGRSERRPRRRVAMVRGNSHIIEMMFL